uniref:Transmembrane protein n=1 Tax=Oryza sativa subsp. japonica TaxID=39947 RepID=Q6EQ51_ORYSJ|nr:hypothetical protein [Oryza sativa Japonica Group]BAD29219.1 hypothetical protein [Oryza sativa Japonica Group]
MDDDGCGLQLWPWRRRKDGDSNRVDSGSGKGAGRKVWWRLGLAAGALPFYFPFFYYYKETKK